MDELSQSSWRNGYPGKEDILDTILLLLSGLIFNRYKRLVTLCPYAAAHLMTNTDENTEAVRYLTRDSLPEVTAK